MYNKFLNEGLTIEEAEDLYDKVLEFTYNYLLDTIEDNFAMIVASNVPGYDPAFCVDYPTNVFKQGKTYLKRACDMFTSDLMGNIDDYIDA